MNNKKILIISSVILIIFIVVLATIMFFPKDKVVTGLDIIVLPSDSQISIDGKNAVSGENSLAPGVHKVSVKRDGFTQKTADYKTKDGEVFKVFISLDPSNDLGKKWVKSHQYETDTYRGTWEAEIVANNIKVSNTYPIINELPIDMSPLYKIYYGVSKKYPNDYTKIAMYISANTNADKQMAIGHIYEMGYDPSDYEIIFDGL